MVYQSTDQAVKHLCGRQGTLEGLMTEMNQKYENIVGMLAKTSEGILNFGSGNHSEQRNRKGIHIEVYPTPMASERGILNSRARHYSSQESVTMGYRMNTKIPKINFPYFSGDGPKEWLRKARKYFQIHQVPDELRVGLAEIYLKGKADIWFHGLITSHPNADWGLLSTKLCRRFAKNTAREVIEIFSKLRQKRSITDYQEQFEEFKSQVMLALPHLPLLYINFHQWIEGGDKINSENYQAYYFS